MSDLVKLIMAQEGWMELNNLYLAELNDLKRRKFKKILEQQFQLETLGEMYKGMKHIIKKNDASLKEKLAKEHNNGWLFITINPKPAVPFSKFKVKVEKLVNRNMFSSAIYAYEQRGSTQDEAGKGFHVHILARRNLAYKPFNCKKNTKNTCKSLVGDVNNHSQLNIQVIGDDFAVDKKNYFMGMNKTGEGKDLKQQVDKIWRKKMHLASFYEVPQKAS